MRVVTRSSCIWIVVRAVEVAGVPAQTPAKQDPKAQEIVRVASQTELRAEKTDDQTHWTYKDVDRKPVSGETVSRVVETQRGSVEKKIALNGQPLSTQELKQQDAQIETFVHDPAQQAKQRKDGAQDDKRAENMCRLLP